MSGAELIAAERKRQMEAEGWTSEHDDQHTLGELAAAGACYALLETRWRDSSILHFGGLIRSILWPWEDQWFKPAQFDLDDRTPLVFRRKAIKNLVRAGALIAAEIDRLERKP